MKQGTQTNHLKQLMPLVLILATVQSSCVSTTVIKTEPSGATVYADGVLLGQSPAFYRDEKLVGSSTSILIKKEGCLPLQTSFSRTEEVQVWPIIGGLFLVIPLLWVMGYKPGRTYELDCARKAAAS